MSDLDRENLKRETRKEERTPLNPSNNNVSGANERSGDFEETNNSSKKKKKIIYGAIGAVLVIGIVLAIALPLALKKDDENPDNPPGPPPTPPLPYDYQEYNPYTTDDSQISSTVFKA